MAVTTFYPTYIYGWTGTATTWDTLRVSGDTTPTWLAGDMGTYAGETDSVHTSFQLKQFYIWFDCSTIPTYAGVGSVTLKLKCFSKASVIVTPQPIYARMLGYNLSPSTVRFVGANNLTALPLLASRSYADWTAGSQSSMTSEAGFLTYFDRVRTMCVLIYSNTMAVAASTLFGSHGEYNDGENVIFNHDFLSPAGYTELDVDISNYAITFPTQVLGLRPQRYFAGGFSQAPPIGLKASMRMKVTRFAPPVGSELTVYDKDMVAQTVIPAAAEWTRNLDSVGSLDATIPRYFTQRDGSLVDRSTILQAGTYVSYQGMMFRVENVSTDRVSELTIGALSREVELANYLSNYSVGTTDEPGAFNRLSMTPTALMEDLLVYGEYDTSWRYEGTMDLRDTEIPHTDPGFYLIGAWTRVSAGIQSATAESILAYATTGAYITTHFGATTGVAIIRVDDVQHATVNISEETTYTVSGLSTSVEHLLEVEVVSGTVLVTGLSVDPTRRISVRWNFKPVTECLSELVSACGGELSFDSLNRMVYHDATQGEDLSAANQLELVVGHNILTFAVAEQRTEVVNRLHYLGYGDGATQLHLALDSTSTVDGQTSQETYGVRHGTYINKEVMDLSTAQGEATRLLEQMAWPRVSYQLTVPDEAAALMEPGDTVRTAYGESQSLTRTSTGGSGISCNGLPPGYIIQANRRVASRGTADSTGYAALVTSGLTLPLTSLEVLDLYGEVAAQLTSADYPNMTTGDGYEYRVQYQEEALRVISITRRSSGGAATLTIGDRVGSITRLIGDPLRNLNKLLTAQ